jgi:hypothetical protein
MNPNLVDQNNILKPIRSMCRNLTMLLPIILHLSSSLSNHLSLSVSLQNFFIWIYPWLAYSSLNVILLVIQDLSDELNYIRFILE